MTYSSSFSNSKSKTLKNSNFTIAISTLNERIEQALQLSLKLDKIGQILIVHQVTHDCQIPYLPSTIRYLQLQGKGVAKSRNAALLATQSKYLWFLDDDVSVDVERTNEFISKSLDTLSTFDVLTVGVLDEYGFPRRKFSSKSTKHNLISIMSVGTIEIIVNRDRIMATSCRFPEDMGAGSDLPVADEPVFLARCLKAGLIVLFTPAFFVSHPSVSSGSEFTNRRASRSRGVAFRRIFGIVGGGTLLTVMYIKNLIKGRIPSRAFLSGYFIALCGLFKDC